MKLKVKAITHHRDPNKPETACKNKGKHTWDWSEVNCLMCLKKFWKKLK